MVAAACTTEPDDGDGAAAESSSSTSSSTTSTTAPPEPDDGDAPVPDAPVDPDAPPPSLTEEELTERLAQMQGRLAVGNGPELAVVRPDGAASIPIEGDEQLVAGQATWSRDGSRLAWSSLSAEAQEIRILSFGDDGLPAGSPLGSDASGSPVFYLQWDGSGDRLAYLRNAQLAGRLEVGLVEPGEPIAPVSEGAPFFLAWDTDSDRLAGHIGEQRIAVHEVADGAESGFVDVRSPAGGFSAPAWVGENTILAVADGALSVVDVVSGEADPLVPLAGPVEFVVSPDRSKVAFQTLSQGGLTLVGDRGGVSSPIQDPTVSLVVLDLVDGQQTQVSDVAALAWEWSPDSSRLAWLEATPTGRPGGRWHFWSEAEESGGAVIGTERTPELFLTRTYAQAYLPFFAQYAQSVTGWSPDSTAFAFAGVIGGDRGVWVQLVDETVSPRLVAPGDIVTWGPGVPPEPQVGAPSAA